MKRKARWIALGIICILSFAPGFSSPVYADQVTIVGTVNESYQIVTQDGAVYEVADTDMGNDLLNHVGEKVEATGMISEEDGTKIIKVTGFRVIEST